MIAINEIYRQVPGLPEWHASNHGNVRWRDSLKPRKGSINHLGYRCVVSYYGVNKTQPRGFRVHSLIALAWCPNPSGFRVVNHIDGNKLNNCPENLEWCSHSHNARHAYATGLRRHGRKLTKAQALDIKRRGHAGERTTDLAKEFGVGITTVSSIKSGHIWKGLAAAEGARLVEMASNRS